MHWYVRHPEHPSLYLRVSRSWSKGITITIRGERLERTSEPGQPFLLELPGGEMQRVYAEDVPFDFAPVLRIGNREVPVAPPLRIWEKGITVVPLGCALAAGLLVGHNGLVPGMLASIAAAAVLRSGTTRMGRAAASLALAAAAALIAFRWNVPATPAGIRQAMATPPRSPVGDALRPLPEPRLASAERTAAAGGAMARPLAPEDVFRLRDLLVTAEFDSLEASFASWSADAETDVAHEPRLYDAFNAFRAIDPVFEGALDRWVAARPDSWNARLARGTYLMRLAYEQRGAKSRRETPRSSFQAMDRSFDAALLDVQAAIRLNPRAVHAYWLASEIAMGQGDARGVELALERSLQVSPLSFMSRARAMMGLRPRWGGSYRRMAAVAAAADSQAGKNPELRALRGFIPMDKGNAAWLAKDTATAVRYLDEAMAFGSTYWFCYERGYLRVRSEQMQAALLDLDCALSLRPSSADAHSFRSRALYRIAYARYPSQWPTLFGRAEAESEVAFRLDSVDTRIRSYRTFLAEQRRVTGL